MDIIFYIIHFGSTWKSTFVVHRLDCMTIVDMYEIPGWFESYQVHTPDDKIMSSVVSFQLFYFKASYKQGEINLDDKVTDYMWVSREELPDYMPSVVSDTVQDFLLEY